MTIDLKRMLDEEAGEWILYGESSVVKEEGVWLAMRQGGRTEFRYGRWGSGWLGDDKEQVMGVVAELQEESEGKFARG